MTKVLLIKQSSSFSSPAAASAAAAAAAREKNDHDLYGEFEHDDEEDASHRRRSSLASTKYHHHTRNHSSSSIGEWDDSGCSMAESTASDQPAIAKQESKDVFRIKLVVLAVLITSAVAVATTIFLYLKWNEYSNFKAEFNDDADKVLQAIGSTLDNILGSFDSLAVSTISFARATNQSWPFVTLPNFAVRMSKVLPLARTFVIYMIPIVSPEQRDDWELYTVENDDWVNESIDVQRDFKVYHGSLDYDTASYGTIHGDFGEIPRNVSRNHLPAWQNFPVVPNHNYTYNWDWLSMSYSHAPLACLQTHQTVLSPTYMIPAEDNEVEQAETQVWGEYFKYFISDTEDPIEPVSDLIYPIVDDIDHIYVAGSGDYEPADHRIVGVFTATLYWRSVLRDVLPTDSNGIHVVIENNCTRSFTYQINGLVPQYLGVHDLHERHYDGIFKTSRLDKLGDFSTREFDSVYSGALLHPTYCPFTIKVYPSDMYKARFTSSNPIIFSWVAVLIFSFTSLVFYLYDSKVERRQEAVMTTARRSSMIVSSLFPPSVREKLYPLPETPKTRRRHSMEAFMPTTSAAAYSSSRDMTASTTDCSFSSVAASPIAELYPDTTVLFADIAGFTAWSSQRQPTEVFHLLETVYAAFDAIARYRGVFKVETIGDSYVAAVGLPAPRNHHAVVMAMFAGDCRDRFGEVTAELEKTLGPGTADLAMRFGLNSGPTTGGVLRGDKARFQLFGDTVNTAARMESNGERNRIQVSQKTADLIKMAGKGNWLVQRAETVACKGKGFMTTYWCDPVCRSMNSSETSPMESKSDMGESSESDLGDVQPSCRDDERLERLIDWHVDLFTALITDMVKYQACINRGRRKSIFDSSKSKLVFQKPLDEVAEVIPFKEATYMIQEAVTTDGEQINAQVLVQLRALITKIASLYQDNPFHNFDHCSQVTMSAKKLLDRIAGSFNVDSNCDVEEDHRTEADMICTAFDPLTRFAIAFSALIHDVDHPGVSNGQLVQEASALAQSYNGKSVAEQNSVVLAWDLLMEPQYTALRRCMFATEEDFKRFRQIVVNVVLATDLFDKDLKAMREERWNKSFSTDETEEVQLMANIANLHAALGTNRRATIIADLVIQASDVSHTMQHFTVYKKWNLRLLTEMHQAYTSGRTTKDPLDGWYDGELWFFDNYVIPLAQKLRECGVFGVSCDEFLDYARDNRLEWEAKGREIVNEAAAALALSRDKPAGTSSRSA